MPAFAFGDQRGIVYKTSTEYYAVPYSNNRVHRNVMPLDVKTETAVEANPKNEWVKWIIKEKARVDIVTVYGLHYFPGHDGLIVLYNLFYHSS